MEIALDQLIQLVTSSVVKELKKQGITISYSSSLVGGGDDIHKWRTKSEKVDMSKYRTPILTESHVRRLHELTGEVIVPKGTVITPKARELVKQKQIVLTIE